MKNLLKSRFLDVEVMQRTVEDGWVLIGVTVSQHSVEESILVSMEASDT